MVINQKNGSILYEVWGREPLADLLTFLKSFKYKKLVIDCTNEFDIPETFYSPVIQEINDYCYENNIEVVFHTGAFQIPYINTSDGKEYPYSFIIRNHPLHFLVKFYTIYIKQIISDVHYYFKEKKIRNYYYVLNNIPHYHRCKFVDLFHKYELNKIGKFTWNTTVDEYAKHNTQEIFKFKHWIEQKTQDGLGTYVSRDPMTLPSEDYFESLFDIVLESTEKVCFFTEKTARPIVYGKPFILVGHKDLHANLVGAGFKLFDNIVDYGFDTFEDIDDRIEGITRELRRLADNFTLEELYLATKDTVDHNKKHIKELALSNKSYYGEIISDFPDVRSYIEFAERDNFLNFTP